jgi:amidohydrolase
MTLDGKQIAELKAQVCADIDRRAATLIAVSHEIHDHPELNFEEHFAHELLTRTIDEAGVPVSRGAYGLSTAFESKVGARGLDIAVLCEYDALPGIGHACGHNVIAAAGLGAGLALAGVAEAAGGRLTLLGTPAEEGGGGKIEMARAGAFRNIAAAMMVHPSDRDLARMNAIAIQQLVVRYEGQAAHAAVSPHLGRNALDAAVLGYLNVAALRQHIRPTERVHGVFTKAGDKANIVPHEAEMSWYVRSDTFDTLQPLKQRVAACLQSSAIATNCHAELFWESNAFADIVDNVPLLEAYAQNSTALGRPLTADYLPGTGGGSTDMGNISYLAPSIHPMLQVAPQGVSLHSPQFAEYTASAQADKAVLDGAKIMAMTVIDLWTTAELQQKVKESFGDGHVPEGVL